MYYTNWSPDKNHDTISFKINLFFFSSDFCSLVSNLLNYVAAFFQALPAEDQVKDRSTGTQVVAGQIFLESGKSDSQPEDEENLHSQEEEKENSLEELNSLDMSDLLNKDLEDTEMQSPGNCLHGYKQVARENTLHNFGM